MSLGAEHALESLLVEMERSLESGRQHHIEAAFGVSVGDRTVHLDWWQRVAQDRDFATWRPSRRALAPPLMARMCGDWPLDKRPLFVYSKRPAVNYERDLGEDPPSDAIWALFASESTPQPVLREFADWCESAEKAARGRLEGLGATLMPPLGGLCGWLALLCRVAVDYPRAVAYSLDRSIRADDRKRSLDAIQAVCQWDGRSDPVYRWEPFEASFRDQPTLPPGIYALSPSRDARLVSVEVVRLLLRVEAGGLSVADVRQCDSPSSPDRPAESPATRETTEQDFGGRGAEAAELTGAERDTGPPGDPPIADKPVWDAARRELSYGGTICREYPRMATAQFVVIDAFQKAGWPSSIRNPFGAEADEQLRTTIKDINNSLGEQCPIWFEKANRRATWRPKVLRDANSRTPC
jgi:hypothetical protein